MLAPHGVDAVVSSPYLRCRETVEPVARAVGCDVADSHHLAEGADTRHTIDWLLSFAGRNVVACSHGDVIPEVLRRLQAHGAEIRSEHDTADAKKASVWTLRVEAGVVTTATYRPPPEV